MKIAEQSAVVQFQDANNQTYTVELVDIEQNFNRVDTRGLGWWTEGPKSVKGTVAALGVGTRVSFPTKVDDKLLFEGGVGILDVDALYILPNQVSPTAESDSIEN